MIDDWRALFGMFVTVAIVSMGCGLLIGQMLYVSGCQIAPDAPRSAYTRPVLRCDLPWWVR